MSSQIFKQKFSSSILFEFLDGVCKNNSPYILNKETFKIITLNENVLDKFISDIEPYYYNSKKHYLKKPMTLNNLFTIVRQICNYLKIKYTSEIKYFKSKYEIVYYIFTDKSF